LPIAFGADGLGSGRPIDGKRIAPHAKGFFLCIRDANAFGAASVGDYYSLVIEA